MTAYAKPTNSAALVTGYPYDPFGRRLYKAPLDERGQPITAQATWFVWDGNRLLQEITTTSYMPITDWLRYSGR